MKSPRDIAGKERLKARLAALKEKLTGPGEKKNSSEKENAGPEKENRGRALSGLPGSGMVEFSRRARTYLRAAMNRLRKPTGQILLSRNVISRSQLDDALNHQYTEQRQGRLKPLTGQLLVNMGYAREEDIVEALNDHYNINASSLSEDIERMIEESASRGRLLNWFVTPPIRIKLTIGILGVVLITALIMTVIFLREQERVLYEKVFGQGSLILTTVADNADILIVEENILALNEMIDQHKEVGGILYTLVVNNDGRIIAHTDLEELEKPYRRPENIISEDRAKKYESFTYVGPEGQRVLDMHKTISLSNVEVGAAHVGISLDFIDESIGRAKRTMLFISALVALFGIAFSMLMGYLFTRPIDDLVTATGEVSNGNYDYQLPDRRSDEFGKLARSFNTMCRELKLKDVIEENFGRYVSSDILEMIVSSPESQWMRGTRSTVTVLFADLRGFTPFTEQNEPEKVVNLLNEFFSIATSCILGQNGYVNKFIGDAVMGVFGVPVSRADHPAQAVRAALQMKQRFEAVGGSGKPLLLRFGIGIATGEVIAGNLGSKVKMEYSVIGNAVNLASRLSDMVNPSEIWVTGTTMASLEEAVIANSLGEKSIKGMGQPIEIYKIEGYAGEAQNRDEKNNGQQ